jgi:hypothetical protein
MIDSYIDAELRNLPKLSYVLHPKTSGIQTCLESLQRCPSRVIHDVTIAYDDIRNGVEVSDISFLKGTCCCTMLVTDCTRRFTNIHFCMI